MTRYYKVLNNTQDGLLALIVKLGPFIVALMPALFIGIAVYREFVKTEHISVAIAFAVIVPFAIESVGIISSHSIVELFNGWREGETHPAKLILVSLMGIIYILSVSGVIYWAKASFAEIIWALGLISPLMAYSAYIATNLLRDHLRASESKAEEKAQNNKQRREEYSKKKAHERELEKIELTYRLSADSPQKSMDSPQKSIDLTDNEIDSLQMIQDQLGESVFTAQDFQDLTGKKRAFAFKTLKRAVEVGIVNKKAAGKYYINGVEL